jgi:hypothetical protein
LQDKHSAALRKNVTGGLTTDTLTNGINRKYSNLPSLKILFIHDLLAIVAMRYTRKKDRRDTRSETKPEATDNR